MRVHVQGRCSTGCGASRDGRTERQRRELRKETLSAPPLAGLIIRNCGFLSLPTFFTSHPPPSQLPSPPLPSPTPRFFRHQGPTWSGGPSSVAPHAEASSRRTTPPITCININVLICTCSLALCRQDVRMSFFPSLLWGGRVVVVGQRSSSEHQHYQRFEFHLHYAGYFFSSFFIHPSHHHITGGEHILVFTH